MAAPSEEKGSKSLAMAAPGGRWLGAGPEQVFADFVGRRSGIIKAFTTELNEFTTKCNRVKGKGSISLFAFPDGRWMVGKLGGRLVPDDGYPEPQYDINLLMETMAKQEWLVIIAVHCDAWLLSCAFYYASRSQLDDKSREILLNMINEVPSVYEEMRLAKKQHQQGRVKGLCAGCRASLSGTEDWNLCEVCKHDTEPKLLTSVEEIYADLEARRAGIKKALDDDLKAFLEACDPSEEKGLALYGLSSGKWMVLAQPQLLPHDWPQPMAGINLIRDRSETGSLIKKVAVYSDIWLHSLARHHADSCDFGSESRQNLFLMMNQKPALHHELTQDKEEDHAIHSFFGMLKGGAEEGNEVMQVEEGNVVVQEEGGEAEEGEEVMQAKEGNVVVQEEGGEAEERENDQVDEGQEGGETEEDIMEEEVEPCLCRRCKGQDEREREEDRKEEQALRLCHYCKGFCEEEDACYLRCSNSKCKRYYHAYCLGIKSPPRSQYLCTDYYLCPACEYLGFAR